MDFSPRLSERGGRHRNNDFFGAIGWIIGGWDSLFFSGGWLFLGNELKFVIIAGLLVYAIIWLLTNALMMEMPL